MRAAFTWNLVSGELAWSDSMYELYGYEPASIRPSMRILLEHKHPDDRPQLNRLLRHAKHELAPYVFRHRIVTTTGDIVPIVVAAEVTSGVGGRAVEISGTAIDLSGVVTGRSFALVERELREAHDQLANLEQALVNRDLIGQAKGILMHAYRIEADEAFELLRLASQRANRKVADIAGEVARTGQLVVD